MCRLILSKINRLFAEKTDIFMQNFGHFLILEHFASSKTLFIEFFVHIYYCKISTYFLRKVFKFQDKLKFS